MGRDRRSKRGGNEGGVKIGGGMEKRREKVGGEGKKGE